MNEMSKCYYLKNGRLDLSVLDEVSMSLPEENMTAVEQQTSIPSLQDSKIYIDETIESIFREMSDYFNQ
ncbi:hypothetical protein [Niameybacter massiliensis]|nr:hypothetical protein [Niameybacter massiliensis]